MVRQKFGDGLLYQGLRGHALQSSAGFELTIGCRPVNISSSLANAKESVDWGCDHRQFYAARLSAVACHSLALGVTWEPIVNSPNPGDDNPHHGGIHGVVELYRLDRDSYDLVITKLAKASEVLPECLAPHATTPLP